MKNQENLILRAPELQDVAFLYALENDQKLWPVSTTRVPFSHLDLEQYILSASRQEPFLAGQVRLVIDYREKNRSTPIGVIDLYELNAIHRRGGVGIVIDEKYRSRSLAGKALDQLIHYAFNLLNLHQLFCSIGKENQASLRLFQSRHFKITGERKEWNLINGKWQDEYFLQLINS
jgi:diamine N-acetyltransferase